jgi:hypothetical protein
MTDIARNQLDAIRTPRQENFKANRSIFLPLGEITPQLPHEGSNPNLCHY